MAQRSSKLTKVFTQVLLAIRFTREPLTRSSRLPPTIMKNWETHYPRYFNTPNQVAAAMKIAALENAKTA